MYHYKVPVNKKIRVIISSDAKNEADDQFAIVHACLTPKFIIKGIVAAHFGSRRRSDSMEASYRECKKLLSIMNAEDLPCYRGAKCALSDEMNYEYSEGAQLIVNEAMKAEEQPLFVVFLGPLTDLACAYLHQPQIAGKLIAIWIGGGSYPDGGIEFNLMNDIKAANIIMESGIELWQVPVDVYSKMRVGFSELQEKVRPHGEIGAFLFNQMIEFNNYCAENYPARNWPKGESWSMGDSPAIGLMIDPQDHAWSERAAPTIDNEMRYGFSGTRRKIRVYNDIDSRFILEDFFCKLKQFHPG